MIVPMLKYTFFVFHKEYHCFLEKLQEIGVLHIKQKNVEIPGEFKRKYARISQYEKVIQFLEKRKVRETNSGNKLSATEIVDDVLQKQKELEELETAIEATSKKYSKAKPWGNFSHRLMDKLNEAGISLTFYSASIKYFRKLQDTREQVEMVSDPKSQVLFVHIQFPGENKELDADRMELPENPYPIFEKELLKMEKKKERILSAFDTYANNALLKLKAGQSKLINELNFEEAIHNTRKEADDQLMILEGWLPKTKDLNLNHYLEKHPILFIKNKPTPQDNIPVLLKNNRFSRLFEPIGALFSLPDYAELDLTVFFAPFFMLFFGFCLGDAGYGLLFLIGGAIYKPYAGKKLIPYLSLIQLLGVATIIFGIISGTLFGINLIETEIPITKNFRTLFLNPDKMFSLSLILGGIQIIFGLFIKAANRSIQYGFNYALATCGWLILILGTIIYVLLSAAGIIAKSNTILYTILCFGGIFILFFSDPGLTVFARIGKGVWDVYSTLTGIFGDLLSYIRLFALGLSSAILGFVINDIGLQILGSSQILGPVFFVVFLLVGHTLNILISSLGSFVHPMRLTFVEFYKSAGFKGGGVEYKPFKK